jgi:hypothetical protein
MEGPVPAPQVGYGKPPRSTRFQKGRSGNPRGRPRGRKNGIPYDSVLGRMVIVRENGQDRRITAAEAFILQLTKKGLEGCSASARASLASIEQARSARSSHDGEQLQVIIMKVFGIGCVVEDLGMAVRINPYSEANVRLVLKPWIVEAAVNRMTPGQLSLEEQKTVLASTRSPEKVQWPDWWQAGP